MSTNEATTTTTTTRAQTREDAAERRERRRNNVRRLREDRLLSKAELARRAGVSPLTIDRIESGKPCRMDTKRKIILALGMTIEEKDKVFSKSEDSDLASEQGDAAGLDPVKE
jgi:DNA-binding XRE family transcriptional regulator